MSVQGDNGASSPKFGFVITSTISSGYASLIRRNLGNVFISLQCMPCQNIRLRNIDFVLLRKKDDDIRGGGEIAQ